MAVTLSEYNRTIVGYHGTSREKAAVILRTQRFEPSRNKGDWLGHGVYFWEYAPKQAMGWAIRRYGKDHATVVASLIRLENCLDLLDPENSRSLRAHYEQLVADRASGGVPMPTNVRSEKNLDCYVLEAYYAQIGAEGQFQIDSSRGVYVPTESAGGQDGAGYRLWKGSWLTFDTHVQICIRPESARSCIIGTWPLVQA